jgi:hypothetical protein
VKVGSFHAVVHAWVSEHHQPTGVAKVPIRQRPAPSNPNGILAPSPGLPSLRGYPGFPIHPNPTASRLWPPPISSLAPTWPQPRCGWNVNHEEPQGCPRSSDQPWAAGLNAVGVGKWTVPAGGEVASSQSPVAHDPPRGGTQPSISEDEGRVPSPGESCQSPIPSSAPLTAQPASAGLPPTRPA